MQTRKFDELISYFNRKVADMSIDTKYKMELLGMVSALGFAHEKELSAQPEQRLDEWCTDCKEYDKEKHSCPRWNRVIRQTLQDAQPEPCEDAVSRKAVKDGFVEMCSLICPYTEKQRHTMCGSCLLGTAFDVLEATQPVTPKQPEQHIDADGTLWITVPDIERVTRVIVDEEKSKFCRQFYMDAQPEQRTDLLKAEIKRMKRSFTICINRDYYTGYMSALSAVEGYIAQWEGDAE